MNKKPNHLSTERLKQVTIDTFNQELVSAKVTDKYPALKNLCPRSQMIMTAIALGYSYRYISDAMKISIATISRTVNAIDPAGRFKEDVDAKKAFIGERCRATALEAIGVITPEKLAECSAPAAAKVAKTMLEAGAIADRKELDLSDGRIKKVTVEFVNRVTPADAIAGGAPYDIDDSGDDSFDFTSGILEIESDSTGTRDRRTIGVPLPDDDEPLDDDD